MSGLPETIAFEGARWELIPPDKIVSFWQEIGTVTVSPDGAEVERKWKIGVSVMGFALYLFTDIEVEKGPVRASAVYALPYHHGVQNLCADLLARQGGDDASGD